MVSRGDYTLTIAQGKAEATIASIVFDANPSMRDELSKALRARFLAVQLLTRKAFELETSRVVRVREDGGRDISREVGAGALRMPGGVLDTLVTDRDGTVINDSRRDRLDRQRSLADLVSSHSDDALLGVLLTSHRNSVNDPDNELVHLYEIRDALSKRFGGDSEMMAALGVSRSNWSRFGRLCNDEPLRQGRHRGKAGSALRDATHAELEEARGTARLMIEAYLRRVDDGTSV